MATVRAVRTALNRTFTWVDANGAQTTIRYGVWSQTTTAAEAELAGAVTPWRLTFATVDDTLLGPQAHTPLVPDTGGGLTEAQVQDLIATALAGHSDPNVIASALPASLTEVAVNTAAEVSLFSLTVDPAKIQGVKLLTLDVAADVLNNSGASNALTLTYYLGGVPVLGGGATIGANALRAGFYGRASIALASLSDQRWTLRHSTSTASAASLLTLDATPRSGVNQSTVDLSTAKTLEVTAKWATAGVTAVRLHSAVLRRAR